MAAVGNVSLILRLLMIRNASLKLQAVFGKNVDRIHQHESSKYNFSFILTNM
jgi:hypothetical protein